MRASCACQIARSDKLVVRDSRKKADPHRGGPALQTKQLVKQHSLPRFLLPSR